MKRLFQFVALMSVSGCAMQAPMQHIVVDQNTVLAKTTDEVMLANLLRAKNNEPMHFSLVSQFHGAATLTAGLTLGAAFPGTATVSTLQQAIQTVGTASNTTTTTRQVTPGVDTFSPSTTGSFSETPSFDSTIVDSQNFFQGFLNPVSTAEVAHFLYDGWRPRLLTYLLVGRFELVSAFDYDQCGQLIDPDKPKPVCKTAKPDAKPLVNKGDVVGYLDNSIFAHEVPEGAPYSKNPFIDAVDHFQITGVAESPEDDTPLFTVKGVSTLTGLEKVDGKTFDVDEGKTFNTNGDRPFDDHDRVLFRKDGSKSTLVLSRYDDKGVRTFRQTSTLETLPFYVVNALRSPDDLKLSTCQTMVEEPNRPVCVRNIPVNQVYTQEELDFSKRADDQLATVDFTIGVHNNPLPFKITLIIQPKFRSPESVFYFVGEYIRKQNEEDSISIGSEYGTFHTSMPFNVSQEWPWGECASPSEPVHPLIVVTPARPQHPILSAELDGTRYYIPGGPHDCNGQSMKVLTLLEQLFYLQVSSSDKLNATPTVHVVP